MNTPTETAGAPAPATADALTATAPSQVAVDAMPEPPPPITAPDVNPPGMDALPPDLCPPGSLTAYNLPPCEDSPGARTADVEARGWMLHAGLPATIGSFIAAEIGRMPDPTGGDDLAFELGRANLYSQLDRMYGADAAAQKLADVQWLVDHADRKSGGKLGNYLEANAGVLLNLQVFGQLAAHAQRMRGRLR